MDSVCVYEQKTVIHELTQGIQMAKKLRVNLNSAEAREFLIQKILSSYENALSILRSGDSNSKGQPLVTTQPATSLPESIISIGSSRSREFEFDRFNQSFFDQQSQNTVSQKRKFPPPPPLPEKHNKKPCQHHQLSPTNPNEMLSNIGSNLSVNTSATVSSAFSFPSTPFGFMEDYQQLNFQNLFDDEPLQVCSPPFISPETSESNYFSEWGSSTSLDYAADPADINPDFIFNSSFY